MMYEIRTQYGLRKWATVVCGCIVLLSQTALFAQFDEDAELPKGLLVRYTVGDRSVERLEETISHDWGSAMPDRRLGQADGPFKARWKSQLLIQQEGGHRFHAFAQGKVRIEVDGKVVFDAESKMPSWISSDEFTPDVGFQSLTVHFEKSAPEARLQLFWSSEVFPLEPLPGHLLFRENGRPDLALLETGRHQFEAFRCGSCHTAVLNGAASLAAPDLTRSVSGLNADWIVRKLSGHVAGKMPEFDLSAEQAQAISAALVSSAEKVKLESLAKPGKGRNDDNDRQSGLTLINSLGCLACHTTKPAADSDSGDIQSEATLFGGGSLADIGSKRSLTWLNTWLRKPESLNRSHRMPVFDLSSQERRQLALALSSLLADASKDGDATPKKDAGTASATNELVKQGNQLILDFGCRSCHVTTAEEFAPPKAATDLISANGKAPDWKKSCIRDRAGSTGKPRQPAYGNLNPNTIRAFVESISKDASAPTTAQRGQHLLVSQNCTACHPRGLRQGLAATAGEIAAGDDALRGQAPVLVPPNLNALGDRLLDAALAKAVGGEQKRRVDWKLVRMPKFKHSDVDRQALATYFISNDRIPDDAPTWDIKDDKSKVDDQTLIVGQELVGPKGFSCIACHQVGDYVPQKVALGTRGSDLFGLGNRMRHSYFVRWTRSPLRIVPGVEMPSYTRAVHGVLGDDIDAQLEALWQTLADPRFKPPTDPASVEQYVVVEKGASVRIIRDVFTNPEQNGGGYVSRAFAIGGNNGHNLLVDLDNFSVRRWTFGDFARQRTVGKSWYWDMAGSDIVAINNSEPDFALVKQDTPDGKLLDSLIWPERENGTVGQLRGYTQPRSGLGAPMHSPKFRYRVNFKVDGKASAVEITQHFNPIDSENPKTKEPATGWHHWVRASGIPAGYDLVHLPIYIDSETERLGEPSHTVFRAEHKLRQIMERKPGREYDSLAAVRMLTEDGKSSLANSVFTSLDQPPLTVTQKPLPPATAHKITSMPGFEGVQLPVSTKIMPTAMTVLDDGTLAFTSLEGHVYLAKDTDGDGVEDTLTMFEEGLSAPYGIIQDGDSLLVSHKPEILRLRDTDGDGRADERTVFSAGWGFNDNYHDWTCGIAKDSKGNFYVGVGSDYAQLKRPKEVSRWRGKVLQISPDGTPRPFAHAFRYPTGIAIDAKGNVFATDNQGVQNTFNELNHLRDGFHFGVPKNHEQSLKVDAHPPAIQIPHPWTRSINGITFLSESYPQKGIAGHGVGCEFNGKLLIRFTHHEVDGILQGATYHLSKPDFPDADANFLGPLSITTAPNGDIYIGSIRDSGWLGGLNTGSIVKLKPTSDLPNGIKEIQATPDGFEIQFQQPINRTEATSLDSYSISGYTRAWKGGYATPDSGRFQPEVEAATLSKDGTRVRLRTSELKTGFLYELNCRIKDNDAPLWPATGHYTLHRIPGRSSQ
jgi:mono/diheme cytochrome c family protein